MSPQTLDLTYAVERVSRLRIVAVCACGWRSRERYTSPPLAAAWNEHVEAEHGER